MASPRAALSAAPYSLLAGRWLLCAGLSGEGLLALQDGGLLRGYPKPSVLRAGAWWHQRFLLYFVAACGSDLERSPRASVTVLDEAIRCCSVLRCSVESVQFSSVSISSTTGSTDFVGSCPVCV